MTTSCLGLGVPLPVVCALFRSRSASSSPFSLLISALALRSIPGLPQLATPLPRAIRSSATRRVGGAHAPAAQACYGIGRQGCNTLVYVRARLEGGPTLRLSVWEGLVLTGVSMCE